MIPETIETTNATAQNTHTTDNDPMHSGHVHGPGCAEHHHRQEPFVRTQKKLGRNDPCLCGSTIKFKKCCGKPE